MVRAIISGWPVATISGHSNGTPGAALAETAGRRPARRKASTLESIVDLMRARSAAVISSRGSGTAPPRIVSLCIDTACAGAYAESTSATKSVASSVHTAGVGALFRHVENRMVALH